MEWSKQTYEAAVSSRCWWYTPYGAGWERSAEYGTDLREDDELRKIVRMEHEVAPIPDWAVEVVAGPMNYLPGCGHYMFPIAFLEAVSAIGDQEAPPLIHGCYTADRSRKERMLDYVFCLDAWLAGVDASAPAAELNRRGSCIDCDWDRVCADLWQVLGEPTELKRVRVERVLHRQRWWIKTLIWDGDARHVFMRDRWLGDPYAEGDSYGNPQFGDPWTAELYSPRVLALKERAAQLSPDSPVDWTNSEHSWLCAPKAFRFLERELWSIGKGRPIEPGEVVPGFLQCEDTRPRPDAPPRWWGQFLPALSAWWRGEPCAGGVAEGIGKRLGEPTPVKRWLVRLLLHKLELIEQFAEVGRLVRPRWHG